MDWRERSPARYDVLGANYGSTRTEDPRLRAKIHSALGTAVRVVNVGAGIGAYEPPDRDLIAVEPSTVMLSQRGRSGAALVRAVAEALPFPDQYFDAAMALWTIHHWVDPGKGIHELRRVANRVVIVAGSSYLNQMWLTREYFPGMARLRRPEIQPERIVEMLGGDASIANLLVPKDCMDGFGEAFWGRPERYLDPQIRAGTSTFRLLDKSEIVRGVGRLESDLLSGAWDKRHGHLRSLDEYDCGLRMIIA